MRSTRSIFDRTDKIEERMMRAVMPRVSATDEVGLQSERRRPEPVARVLTYRLADAMEVR